LAATISISSWNYAYAVLENRVRMKIVAEGYDPTIGFLHNFQADRLALVFDFMEPMRPTIVGRWNLWNHSRFVWQTLRFDRMVWNYSQCAQHQIEIPAAGMDAGVGEIAPAISC
jgi:hypothetical protein